MHQFINNLINVAKQIVLPSFLEVYEIDINLYEQKQLIIENHKEKDREKSLKDF